MIFMVQYRSLNECNENEGGSDVVMRPFVRGTHTYLYLCMLEQEMLANISTFLKFTS